MGAYFAGRFGSSLFYYLRLKKAGKIMNSTTLNSRSENVVVEAIIIPELELRNVKWHVFSAHLVERADDTALEDRPEALNRSVIAVVAHRILQGGFNQRISEHTQQ
jgi:hypothetical protein